MNKLKAKNTLYNDPMYDVVVDSRMLEQHLKEKDQQITELQKQLEEKDEEIKGLNKKLDNLWSIYSLLGVEAFGNDIQEQALKEIVKLQRKNDVKKLKKQLKSQPAEIVEEIRKHLQKQYNWADYATGCDGLDYNECIGFNMAIDQLNAVLDTILKNTEVDNNYDI